MIQKILIAGATGHLGRHLVPRLVRRYGAVTCFVRPTSDRSLIALPGVSFVEGDLSQRESVQRALQGVDVVVSLAVLQSCAEQLVRACQAANVQRGIFIGTTSIFTRLETATKLAKIAAEKAVTNCGLDYTVLRPTMIYGTPEDRNMARMVRFLRRSPVFFIPGDGQSLQQPIHVEDVADAIVDCIEFEGTIGKAYNLSGAEAITFNQVIDHACHALGVRRLKVHLPLRPALWAARFLSHLMRQPYIKEEQILRLNEDKSFDHSDARNDLGFAPRSFADGIRQEVALFKSHWADNSRNGS